jgi:hypothetical protein
VHLGKTHAQLPDDGVRCLTAGYAGGISQQLKGILLVVGSVVLAAYGAATLSYSLQSFIVPPGESLVVNSPREAFNSLAAFTFWLCACAALVAGTFCYLRSYPVIVRGLIVLVPMLLVGLGMAFLKAEQASEFFAYAAQAGSAQPMLSIKQVALPMVPAGAFAAGLAGVAVACWARRARPAGKRE